MKYNNLNDNQNISYSPKNDKKKAANGSQNKSYAGMGGQEKRLKNSRISLEDVLADRVAEEDYMEVPLTDNAFKIFSLVTTLVFFAVIFQVLNLGVFKSDFYKKRAVANVSNVNITLAPRGIITDRFNEPLLQNESSSNVFIAPMDLSKGTAERINTLKTAGDILKIDFKEIQEKIIKHNWELTDKILLAQDISHDELVELKTRKLPGILIEPGFKRKYVFAESFSHILGYTGLVNQADLKTDSFLTINDEIGRTGLEDYYDSFLRGKNGQEIIYKDARGKVEGSKVLELPKIGAELITFVDKELQEYFYERLKTTLQNLGRNIGVGIAMNPKNGEILALVNIPGFKGDEIAKYLKAPDEPLFNRAISGLYTPGSTIKPLVAIAALTQGVIKPEKEIFSRGFIEIPNPYNPENPSRFLDWKPHGWVNLYSALARSSNVYFYEVGGGFESQKGLGINRLKEWWGKFGLNQKTAIDLTGEKFGFLPDAEWKEKSYKIPWRIGDTYNASIGQGDLMVTPLELLNYISAIANGGQLYKLRVMEKIIGENGELIAQNEPEVLKDISAEIAEALPEIQRGMRDAVVKPYGTANLLADLPMNIMAKTGSSQVANNTKVNAFFVGYTNDLAILVLVENAREGSLNAVPVAKDVFRWYYDNRVKNYKL